MYLTYSLLNRHCGFTLGLNETEPGTSVLPGRAGEMGVWRGHVVFIIQWAMVFLHSGDGRGPQHSLEKALRQKNEGFACVTFATVLLS